ncbi:MAG: T9SS type A sorting domain-containing protein [bacterium]|nr:T9SS type A sorting domain-containing protein [bacterium]
MIKKYLILLIILTGTNLFAGAPDTLWTRTYGTVSDDLGYSVQQTQDSGFIISGTTYFGAGAYPDIYLVKTNCSGDTLWTRILGGDKGDFGWSIQQAQDGGFIIAGTTSSFGAGLNDVYLIKTNSSGDTLWTKTFGGTGEDYGYSIQQTEDGGFIIAGMNDFEVYLIKTDSLGDTLWTKTYGGVEGHSVRQTQDGGFIIAGKTSVGNDDIYLVKTNSSGVLLWTKTFGGTGEEHGYSVQQTFDSGFIVTGYTKSFGAGGEDVYLIKTNSLGDSIWARTYGGTDSDEGISVQQTQDSGFIVAGWTWSFGAGSWDVYLIKTNPSGDTMWTKTFGGTGWDEGRSVQQTSDGGFIIAGWTHSFGAGYSDVYLIRLGKDGAGVEEKSKIKYQKSNMEIIKDKIFLSVPKSMNVDVKIYDLCGRLQSTVYEGALSKGNYTFTPSIKKNGVYFVVLRTDNFAKSAKIIKLK